MAPHYISAIEQQAGSRQNVIRQGIIGNGLLKQSVSTSLRKRWKPTTGAYQGLITPRAPRMAYSAETARPDREGGFALKIADRAKLDTGK
ncbi:hypothetical protein F6R98_09190 [Candidatus Methylospira mobilis]|uniref:Uncharacterized protein n=1 Tax=Candidatus Methylospira mobilis TaxID=1808979 RepID=A0A5Q0BKP0_9GAMM|nr:hypothetical protein [Candidatus Methylospira mobilis]QFY42774.1 hypothetical protein F6R98_09190 [Candidatus Methylospira mobilis]